MIIPSTLVLKGEDLSSTQLTLKQMYDDIYRQFLDSGFIPVGGIIAWSGLVANIPDGWVLCDGNNGTPDLSGHFIVGQ